MSRDVNAAIGSSVALERPIGADAEQRGSAAEERRGWRCVCGQVYGVSGLDRRRVYWPIDAPPTLR